jgi:hypothetical protein
MYIMLRERRRLATSRVGDRPDGTLCKSLEEPPAVHSFALSMGFFINLTTPPQKPSPKVWKRSLSNREK